MATILGITGAIGSGKTTVSELLAELEPACIIYESGQLIAELANSFNQALSSEMDFEATTADVDLVNQVLIWFTEAVNEQLHQDIRWNQLALTPHRLAAHAVYYEKLFAYLKAVRLNPALVRQPIIKENKTEYRTLLQWLGGYLVAAIKKTIWFDELFRRIDIHDGDKKLIIINGLRYPSDAEVVWQHGGLIIAITRPDITADTQDITEAERKMIMSDSTLTNDGTLKQLRTTTEQLWQDVCVSELATHYRAQEVNLPL